LRRAARVGERVARVLDVLLWSSFSITPTATPEIYALSLHDALPICRREHAPMARWLRGHLFDQVIPFWTTHSIDERGGLLTCLTDRKSTRLNSSHVKISYAVFCLKKKIQITYNRLKDNRGMVHQQRH